MFNGYFDANSECLFGLCGMKIRQNPPEAGMTSLGACLPNATVAETTMKFMKTIRFAGIVDIDYIFDIRDSLYKVVDVNPRIGSTFRLFVSDTGMDVARALYLDLTDQRIVAGHYLLGRKWVVEPADLKSAFRSWSGGRLKITEWMRSFRGVEECAYFSANDPRPMIVLCANYLPGLFHSQGIDDRACGAHRTSPQRVGLKNR